MSAWSDTEAEPAQCKLCLLSLNTIPQHLCRYILCNPVFENQYPFTPYTALETSAKGI